jgi:hypothetical protein
MALAVGVMRDVGMHFGGVMIRALLRILLPKVQILYKAFQPSDSSSLNIYCQGFVPYT